MGKAELKLQIDAELLERAKAAGLDLAEVAEAAVREAVEVKTGEDQAQHWAAKNAEALAAHRAQIEKYGVFGEDFRTW